MKHSIKSIFITLCIMIILQACSSIPLKNTRLNSAEDNIYYAEQALSASQIVAADNYLGTATAYLATIEDFKKSLNLSEMKKFQALKQRERNLTRAIQSRK